MVFRAPGPAAVCAGGRRSSCLLFVAPTDLRPPRGLPARFGRRAACPPASAVRAASFARRVASKPCQAPQASRRPPIGRGDCVLSGLAPPPPTGTAAGPSGALHTSGAWSLTCGGVCCFAFRPGPAAPAMSHAIPSNVFHGLKFDRWNSADSALMWRRAERELHAELWDGVSPPRSCLFLRRNALVAGGIALLGLTMHCLVARATVCYLVHCLPFRCNALPG